MGHRARRSDRRRGWRRSGGGNGSERVELKQPCGTVRAQPRDEDDGRSVGLAVPLVVESESVYRGEGHWWAEEERGPSS